MVRPVLTSAVCAIWSSIVWAWNRNSLLDGISLSVVVIAAIPLLTSSIHFVITDNSLRTAWFEALATRRCKVLSLIRLLGVSSSWRILVNKSVASLAIWLSCDCRIWIPDRNSCKTAYWRFITDSTPVTLESILAYLVCILLSIIKIPFRTESNSSSRTTFPSLHACITCTTCWASSDNCFRTKLVLLVICISPWPLGASSGSSCTLSSKYSLRASSILLWHSRHHSGIALPTGNRGFSILELLGASTLLVYVNRLLRVAILNHMAIIWCLNYSVQFNCYFVPMRVVFEVTMIRTISCNTYESRPFILPRYLYL